MQFVEFCENPGTDRSYASWSWDSAGHLTTGDARIGALEGNDYYVQYSVYHELGHVPLGLAHTDECASVMTYCSTVGTQYLRFTGTDFYVLNVLYDAHPS